MSPLLSFLHRTKPPSRSPQAMSPNQGAKAVPLADSDRPIIIRVTNLEKTYDIGTPRETAALRGVNFEISLAEIVILFGPSGSGKSTMLNILAGLDSPTGGRVEIDGKDLTKMTAHERALYHQYKVGMVFQSYNLVQTFTVLQNITMPARLAGFKRDTYFTRGWDLLRQFELEKLAYRLPSEISGGQQQRVGIMRAFMNRPSFIIADEPTGNLDSANSQRIMELFKELNEQTNTTMVIVSHDPSLFSIADRVIHIFDGKITKQTILTAKAKIDPSKVDVPVEFKLRSEEKKAMQEELTGGKIAPKGKPQLPEIIRLLRAKKLWVQDEAERLREQEAELHAFWQVIRRRQEEVAQRAAAVEHERAVIAREGQHVEHEREAVVVAQLRVRERQRAWQAAQAEQRAAWQKISHELATLEQLKARLHANTEARRREIEREVAIGWERLSADKISLEHERAKLRQARAEVEATVAKQLAIKESRLASQKQHLAQLQGVLERREQEQTRAAEALAAQQATLVQQQRELAGAQQALQEQRTAVGKEAQQLQEMRTALAAQRSWLRDERAALADQENTLFTQQQRLRQEHDELAAQQTELTAQRGVLAQEEAVAQQLRKVLQTKQEWYTAEAERLTGEEQRLLLQREQFDHDQAAAEVAWQESTHATQQEITTLQQRLTDREAALKQERTHHQEAVATTEAKLRQARRELAAKARSIEQAEQLLARHAAAWETQQKKLRDEQAQLAQERQALETAEQTLAQSRQRHEQELQHRLATATDIIDHEREQFETQRQRQETETKERNQITERKLTAARKIVRDEMEYLARERQLLEEEKKLLRGKGKKK